MSKVSRNTCAYADCKREYWAKNYCALHYRRFRIHGSTELPTPAQKFWEKVVITADITKCWIWIGANPRSYGKLTVGKKLFSAHRFAFFLFNGRHPLPDLHVLHKCGKGHLGCVNPYHLYEGTRFDNARDAEMHGTRCKGETHGRAKLTANEVLKLRQLYFSTKTSYKKLGKKFNVSTSAARCVVKNYTWRHLGK